MFLGRYYHTIEEKGRISLPKKFREESEKYIVTRGIDGGLFLFTPEEWGKQVGELTARTFTKKSQRDFVRLMTNDAQEVETDKQGRILLPEYLRTYAKLQKQAVVVGSYNKVEIWDVNSYHQYIQELETREHEIAETMEPAQESSL